MTRIVAFAYSLVGYRCLKALIDANETIAGVITHPDNPAESLWFPSVSQLAKDYHIPVIATESPRDKKVLAALQGMQAELIFSFYYRRMIPDIILDMPRLGSFNMHGSLLPRYRGRAPINWALVNGERETGATLHHMVKSADAGNIVDQEAVPIGDTENAYDLTHKVADAAVRILNRQLPALKEGRAPSLLQDHTQATRFGGRTAEDSRVNWHQSAWQIHNLVRAVPYPYYPPAFTYLKEEKIEIHANRLPEMGQRLDTPASPGQVVATGDGWVRVACGKGEDFIEVTKLSIPFKDIKEGYLFL